MAHSSTVKSSRSWEPYDCGDTHASFGTETRTLRQHECTPKARLGWEGIEPCTYGIWRRTLYSNQGGVRDLHHAEI